MDSFLTIKTLFCQSHDLKNVKFQEQDVINFANCADSEIESSNKDFSGIILVDEKQFQIYKVKSKR